MHDVTTKWLSVAQFLPPRETRRDGQTTSPPFWREHKFGLSIVCLGSATKGVELLQEHKLQRKTYKK